VNQIPNPLQRGEGECEGKHNVRESGRGKKKSMKKVKSKMQYMVITLGGGTHFLLERAKRDRVIGS
jgi:hypothetical protein